MFLKSFHLSRFNLISVDSNLRRRDFVVQYLSKAMPKRAAEVHSSPGIQRNKPDSFSNYRSQVAELLSQGEKISVHHDQEASESDSSKNVIGAGMSKIEKENLNVLLRQCVRNLTPEVDEMQQSVCAMSLISQLGNKCLSSSPSILSSHDESGGSREDDIQLLMKSDPDLVKKISSQYSNVMLSKLDNMQQQLENLLDDVVATCRPMTRDEIRELQKSIKELPERNLIRVTQIVGNSNITSDKDNNEVIVNLDNADNITLWRLHFYVGAVKSAQKLALSS